MKKIIFGGLAAIVGVIGFSTFFCSFLTVLAGVLPILLIAGGGLAAYLGYTDVQAEKEEEKEEVSYLEDEPPAAQPSPSGDPEPEAEAKPAPDGTPAYKGNADTQVFHSISCKFAGGKKCTVDFATREEAISQGYKPCKVCNP